MCKHDDTQTDDLVLIELLRPPHIKSFEYSMASALHCYNVNHNQHYFIPKRVGGGYGFNMTTLQLDTGI